MEDFVNEDSESESESKELDEKSGESNKEYMDVFQLQNPKIRCGKEKPVGTVVAKKTDN